MATQAVKLTAKGRLNGSEFRILKSDYPFVALYLDLGFYICNNIEF